jgi:diguanylate cyclase (GGDEF)-like protein
MPLIRNLTLPDIALLKRVAFAVLTVLMIVSTFLGWKTLQEFEAANNRWISHSQRATTIGDTLYSLQRNIGYGGMIHNFKNLVLRGNINQYEESLALQFKVIHEHLDHLEALLFEDKDKMAVQQVRTTMLVYAQQFKKIQAMRQQSIIDGSNRDQTIRVDDRPALDALQQLGNRAQIRAREAEQQAQQRFESALGFFFFAGGLFLFAVALTSGTLFWIIANLSIAFKSLNHTKLQLEASANTDFLTGLNNRREFIRRVLPLLAQTKRTPIPAAIAMLDIDHFKNINDQFGHDIGDRVLVQVSQQIKNTLRSTDIVARWGGEEFCIFTYNTDRDGAIELFNKLIQTIAAQPIHIDQSDITVTVSIGVSTTTTLDLDATISNADHLLYQAKHNGRNQVVVEG